MKNSFQTLAQEILDHWASSLTDPIDIVVNDTVETGYGIARKDYQAMKDSMTTDTISTFKSGNKVFFMPACPVTQNRLKNLCKNNGLVISNDASGADIIIHNDKAFLTVSHSPENISTHHIAFENVYELVASDNVVYDRPRLKKPDTWRSESITSPFKNIASPLFMLLAYEVQVNGKQVMSIDSFVNQASQNVTQPITSDMVETFSQMIKSYDSDNNKLAAELLLNIDYNQNKHLLWELVEKCGIGRIAYLDNRNKDYKTWFRDSKLEEYDCSAERMIKLLFNLNELTAEAFEHLEKYARKEISIHNRDMYVFEVKLNPTWKQILTDLKTSSSLAT